MAWKTPHTFSTVDLAFPGNVVKNYMPQWDEIPDEFKRDPNSARSTADMWFFNQLLQTDPKPKFVSRPGIEANKAVVHIHVVLGSYEPRHEHKVAGAAMLIDLYFEKITKGSKVIFDGGQRPPADPPEVLEPDPPTEKLAVAIAKSRRCSIETASPSSERPPAPLTAKALKAKYRASNSPLSLKAWARQNGYMAPVPVEDGP